jgi:galactonate dehydratase
VRALAPLHGETDEELTRSLRAALLTGFRAVQVPLPTPTAHNQGQVFQEAVRARLGGLMKEAGPGIDFVLDGAGGLTPGDAASVASTVERSHVLWFDEPCRIMNTSTLHKLSDESVTPLGFGRGLHEPGVFQDLLREGVIDVVRPDLHHYGIPRVRQIAALAETWYTAMAPHHEGGPVGTAAALHLAASLPNFFIQHLPLPAAEEDRRMRAELAGAALEAPHEGFLALPTGNGLGIEVNEQALEKYKEAQA